MQAPNLNPYLSGMARALWMVYATVGRPMSTEEVIESNYMNEGRDAIRAAASELKRTGYIKAFKEQVAGGRWVTTLRFTPMGQHYLDLFNWNYQPMPGIPTVGEPGITSKLDSSNRLEILRISNLGADAPREEIMPWPIDEPQPKKKRELDTDYEVGSVGKVEDKIAKRNAKYKKTTIESTPAVMRRYEKPEELWDTKDLIGEFYDLVKEHAPGVPSQVNGKYLATWINDLVGKGTPRVAILKAIRMFFSDPRLYSDAGVGHPLYRRFFQFYPTVHGKVIQPEVKEYVDDDFAAHQEKMLKLLGGN
jgi:hypothetical protein